MRACESSRQLNGMLFHFGHSQRGSQAMCSKAQTSERIPAIIKGRILK